MLFSLPIAIIGYAVIANTHITSVKYGMTFLMATGLYSSVPPVLGWLSNVSASVVRTMRETMPTRVEDGTSLTINVL